MQCAAVPELLPKHLWKLSLQSLSLPMFWQQFCDCTLKVLWLYLKREMTFSSGCSVLWSVVIWCSESRDRVVWLLERVVWFGTKWLSQVTIWEPIKWLSHVTVPLGNDSLKSLLCAVVCCNLMQWVRWESRWVAWKSHLVWDRMTFSSDYFWEPIKWLSHVTVPVGKDARKWL